MWVFDNDDTLVGSDGFATELDVGSFTQVCTAGCDLVDLPAAGSCPE